MKIKVFLLICVFALLNASLPGQTALENGIKLYMDNKPGEAKLFFEEAMTQNPGNEEVYIYLATTYEQLNDHESSLKILEKGINVARKYKDLFYLNMGNNLKVLGQKTLAEGMYSRTISINQAHKNAYINRANVRLELEKWQDALDDYKKYLQVYPGTPRRAEVEEVIRLLTELLDEEARKLAEEKQKADNLKDLLDILDSAEDNTTNISVGTGELEITYEDEELLD